MALTDFEVEEGINIDDLASIKSGSVDPSSVGKAAPLGSLYLRNDSAITYKKTGGTDTDWTVLIDADDTSDEDAFQNTFMGKTGAGSELPDYTTNNVVADNDNLEVAIGKLDGEIGVAVTPESRTYSPTSDQAINLNIDDLDTAIGNDAEHINTTYSTVNASLKTNISELDGAIADIVYKETGSNQVASGGLVVDEVLVASVCMAEWHLCVTETGTPANRRSFKITAINDGTITNIDHTVYAKNKVGAAITGLAVDVVGASGEMRLEVTATPNIDYTLTRISG